MRSFPIVAAICLLSGACNQPATPAAQSRTSSAEARENAAVEQDVANIQAGVLRDTNVQRLNELERRIAQLESTPDKLDLELLTSRVQALEVKAGVDSLAATTPGVPDATLKSQPKPSAKPTPSTSKPVPRPQPSPSDSAETSKR